MGHGPRHRKRADIVRVLPTDPDWVAAVKNYSALHGDAATGEKIGCSESTVYNLLNPGRDIKLGKDLIYRVKVLLMDNPPQPPQTEDMLELINWYLENRSPKYIREALNISQMTLHQIKATNHLSRQMSDRICRTFILGERLPPCRIRTCAVRPPAPVEPGYDEDDDAPLIDRCPCCFGLSFDGRCKKGCTQHASRISA